MNYRLYTFVAGNYLSPLQCGLQTAHVVSELSKRDMVRFDAYVEWAAKDKTIIICNAGNHQGVLDCWAELQRTYVTPHFGPGAIFFEDEQSMNGMATACGVIVPKKYWDVTWVADEVYFGGGYWQHAKVENPLSPDDYEYYVMNDPEGQFIKHLKSFRLV